MTDAPTRGQDRPIRVVCTAGHVDHGKSTLVAALTGTDPHRLAEERRRGLTIDLGFAWTDVEGTRIAFVDLPGHERFVPNMLAGAGLVRIALLVVAADEGWMPQSAEHLDILRLLDVQHGVVALTRTDLVDAETVELGVELVREELAGSGLAAAPIVPVSSTTGEGVEAVAAALARVTAAAPAPPDRGRPRLWVDRSFTIAGAGTVVTGTLAGGSLAVGDRLAVLPGGQEARIRGLQVLGESVTTAPPGVRAAVNLVGVDVAAVPRGRALGHADRWVVTDELDAWCAPVSGRVLGRRGAWRLHVGTAAVDVDLHPVGGRDLDGAGGVRLTLEHPLPLAAGDRVVLRESGAGGTAGGGWVVNPAPGPRPRGSARRAQAVEAVARLGAARTPAERLVALVAHAGELPADRAAALADAGEEDRAATDLLAVGTHLMTPERWSALADAAVTAVTAAHAAHPALAVADRAVVRDALADAGADPEVVPDVVAALVDRGALEAPPGGVRLPGHRPVLSGAQQRAREAVLAALDAAGVEAPELRAVAAEAGADADLLEAVVRDGDVVVLGRTGRAMSRTAWDRAVAVLQALQAAEGPFSASAAREAWGTSRKHALPLLEAMDERGATRRRGDLRELTT